MARTRVDIRREQRQARRRAGLCTQCGKPAGPESKAYCSEHHAAHRRWVANRKRQGLCVQCGSALAEGDERICSKCRAQQKARDATLKAAGICLCCGTAETTNGKIYCEPCDDKRKNKQRDRKAAGICNRCDSPVEWEGGSSCARHNALDAKRQRNIQARAADEFCASLPPRPDGAQPIGVIYQIRHRASGLLYVGKTTSTLKERWSKHIQSARRGVKRGQFALDIVAAHAAGRVHEAFEITVLRPYYTPAEGSAFEHQEINARGTMAPHGYNRCSADLERKLTGYARAQPLKKVARAA